MESSLVPLRRENHFIAHSSITRVWGVLSLASAAALEVVQLWTCTDTLSSLAYMGRYPRVLRAGLSMLDLIHTTFPLLAPRKARWSAEDKAIDALHRAGSIGFVMRRATVDGGSEQN